jgi:hypothetical protein
MKHCFDQHCFRVQINAAFSLYIMWQTSKYKFPDHYTSSIKSSLFAYSLLHTIVGFRSAARIRLFQLINTQNGAQRPSPRHRSTVSLFIELPPGVINEYRENPRKIPV